MKLYTSILTSLVATLAFLFVSVSPALAAGPNPPTTFYPVTTQEGRPFLSWDELSGADWHQLYICKLNASGGCNTTSNAFHILDESTGEWGTPVSVIDIWYPAYLGSGGPNQGICNGTGNLCRVDGFYDLIPNGFRQFEILQSGDYGYWVNTYDDSYPTGEQTGPWSTKQTFSVAAPQPVNVADISPITYGDSSFMLDWANSDPDVSWYQVLIGKVDAQGNWTGAVYNKWWPAGNGPVLPEPPNPWDPRVHLDCKAGWFYGPGTCSLMNVSGEPMDPSLLTLETTPAAYHLYIKAFSPINGLTDWSDPITFVKNPPQIVSTLHEPTYGGDPGSEYATFSWEGVEYADEYGAVIRDSSETEIYNQVHTASSLNCSTLPNTCSFNTNVTLNSTDTNFTFTVQAFGNNYYNANDPDGWAVPYGFEMAAVELTANYLFTDNKWYGYTDEVFTFLDMSTVSNGTIQSWYWDFGDGSTSTLQNPSHQYAELGSYYVSLTVTSGDVQSEFTRGVPVNIINRTPLNTVTLGGYIDLDTSGDSEFPNGVTAEMMPNFITALNAKLGDLDLAFDIQYNTIFDDKSESPPCKSGLFTADPAGYDLVPPIYDIQFCIRNNQVAIPYYEDQLNWWITEMDSRAYNVDPESNTYIFRTPTIWVPAFRDDDCSSFQNVFLRNWFSQHCSPDLHQFIIGRTIHELVHAFGLHDIGSIARLGTGHAETNNIISRIGFPDIHDYTGVSTQDTDVLLDDVFNNGPEYVVNPTTRRFLEFQMEPQRNFAEFRELPTIYDYFGNIDTFTVDLPDGINWVNCKQYVSGGPSDKDPSYFFEDRSYPPISVSQTSPELTFEKRVFPQLIGIQCENMDTGGIKGFWISGLTFLDSYMEFRMPNGVYDQGLSDTDNYVPNFNCYDEFDWCHIGDPALPPGNNEVRVYEIRYFSNGEPSTGSPNHPNNLSAELQNFLEEKSSPSLDVNVVGVLDLFEDPPTLASPGEDAKHIFRYIIEGNALCNTILQQGIDQVWIWDGLTQLGTGPVISGRRFTNVGEALYPEICYSQMHDNEYTFTAYNLSTGVSPLPDGGHPYSDWDAYNHHAFGIPMRQIAGTLQGWDLWNSLSTNWNFAYPEGRGEWLEEVPNEGNSLTWEGKSVPNWWLFTFDIRSNLDLLWNNRNTQWINMDWFTTSGGYSP